MRLGGSVHLILHFRKEEEDKLGGLEEGGVSSGSGRQGGDFLETLSRG